MDVKKLKPSIQELIKLLEKSSLEELEVTEENTSIRIRKAGLNTIAQVSAAPPPIPKEIVEEPKKEKEKKVTPSHSILSPMVGTAYLTPSPDADPFVKVGDKIKSGDTVCLIEAMKMFNKIKADKGGTVSKINFDNGQAIEFNLSLIHI